MPPWNSLFAMPKNTPHRASENVSFVVIGLHFRKPGHLFLCHFVGVCSLLVPFSSSFCSDLSCTCCPLSDDESASVFFLPTTSDAFYITPALVTICYMHTQLFQTLVSNIFMGKPKVRSLIWPLNLLCFNFWRQKSLFVCLNLFWSFGVGIFTMLETYRVWRNLLFQF